jgi:RNA recognition motif-containing protein
LASQAASLPQAAAASAPIFADHHAQPNKILFLKNIPTDSISSQDLEDYFKLFVVKRWMQKSFIFFFFAPVLIKFCFSQPTNRFNGFKEVRVVPGKSDLAFVEFENEVFAYGVKTAMASHPIKGNSSIVVTFANK